MKLTKLTETEEMRTDKKRRLEDRPGTPNSTLARNTGIRGNIEGEESFMALKIMLTC